MFFADMHCDTITKLADCGGGLQKNDLQVDLEKLSLFDAPLQFFAVWLDPALYTDAYAHTLRYLRFFREQMEACAEKIAMVRCCQDIERNRTDGRASALLSIEGGECLEGQIDRIDALYEEGVRAFSLTWNHDNALACGCNTADDRGLTDLGRAAVARIAERHMLLDVSHCSEQTFWDVMQIYHEPVIASHSNARGVRDHPRNLDDAQLRAIAERGGVVGINLFSDFLGPKKRGELEDILAHIAHIIQVVGAEHVGFGCDFEGMVVTPVGIETVADLVKVEEALRCRYGAVCAEKVMGQNVLRVVKHVLGQDSSH